MILQGFAWAGMFARFAQDGTVSEAVSKTFDGKHPCRLCHLVREGRAEERQAGGSATIVAPAKLDLIPAKPCLVLSPVETEGRQAVFGVSSYPSQRRASPPVPPPRAA